jgi:hypothetical protein
MFLFWTIWPYIIARVTRVMLVQFTGKDISKSDLRDLRKNLTTIKPNKKQEKK